MLHLRMDDEPYIAQWVANHFKHIERFGRGRALGWYTEGDELVGGVVICPRGGYFDAEITAVFEPGWERYVTRTHLRTLFELCYDEWGYARLTGYVAKRNKIARRFAVRLGAQLEGVLRRGFDGRQTAILYGMLREDCRFLRKKGAHREFNSVSSGPDPDRDSAG